jgi:hypothetical protein
MGGGGNSNTFIVAVIIGSMVLYVLIFGTIYFKNYKKFLDEKWSFSQYIILMPVIVPIFFLFFGIAVLILDSIIASGRNELLLLLAGAIGFLIISAPLIFRRVWMYKLVIPMCTVTSVFFFNLDICYGYK